MMVLLCVWQVVLVLALLVLAVMLVALARQIGVLHERLAPLGDQEVKPGLDVGQVVPRLILHTLEGQPFTVGDVLRVGRKQLLLFVAAECPVCKRVSPIVRQIAAERGLDLVFVGDGPEPELKAMQQSRPEMQGLPLITGVELALVLQINRMPSVVVLDERGTILAKDLVNTRRQIEGVLDGIATTHPALPSDTGANAHVAF
ncbi:alkyl hydroperoxide reductase [Acetobacter syzygii]|uniref:Alkyl hydroperoxide reductase n=2 Tax=Acetobacter syzygii TaxID=146476 RepID=A0A270BQU4_9PROT|nr:alkyl hydroperoxide reductase [Acetobacter syzygii]PAL27615.1 alkyl hydroperoxide reductase [Acetobacter syzygii]